MGFFNEKQVEAFKTGVYICSKCGAKMEFEDEWEDVLICSKCGESVDIDKYGFKDDEEYEALYENNEDGADGVEPERCRDAEGGFCVSKSSEKGNSCGETYDEVCGELDD